MTLTSELDVATAIEAIVSADSDRSRYAFDWLHDHYAGQLINYGSLLGASDPEGAANLALFDTFRAIDRLQSRTEATFSSYLYTAMRSHIKTDARKQRAVPEPVGGVPEIDRLMEDFDDVEERFVESHWLRHYLDGLPTDQRLVLELSFFEGLSGREMASRLQRPPNAVYQLQHRAITRLRRLIVAAAVVAAVAGAAFGVYLAGNDRNEIRTDPIDSVPTTSPQDLEPRAEDDNGDETGQREVGPSTTVATNAEVPVITVNQEPAPDPSADGDLESERMATEAVRFGATPPVEAATTAPRETVPPATTTVPERTSLLTTTGATAAPLATTTTTAPPATPTTARATTAPPTTPTTARATTTSTSEVLAPAAAATTTTVDYGLFSFLAGLLDRPQRDCEGWLLLRRCS